MSNEQIIQKTYSKILFFLSKVSRKKKYKKMFQSIQMIANFLYNYNYIYSCTELEEGLQQLATIRKSVESNEIINKTIFFDSFGLSNRGIAKNYIKALITKKCEFTYITYSDKVKNNELIDIVNECPYANIFLIDNNFESINKLYSWFLKAENILLYIMPDDVLPLVSCVNLKATKYLINLTDHAFWLGSSVLDYSLEFRDYGYNVSVQKRKIDKSKLIKLPYYPLYKKVAFQGYPLKNMNKENTIVSGGSLYKTINDDLLFYKMIEQILEKHTDMYFWYLGNNGDDTYLKELQARFEGRVVHTSERIDLMELLKNSKLYLSTYPIAGALMTQYSALAGIPCLTIVNDQDATGLLAKSGKEVFEYENSQELLEDADKLLSDKVYYDERVKNLSNLIITEEKFADELEYILNNKCGRFEFKEFKAETENLQKSYIERFKYNDYLSLVTNKKFTMFSVFYKEYFKRLLFKIFKINK